MADQRIQYTEEMVGAGHPTKADTLNRLQVVEHEADGKHGNINSKEITPQAHDAYSLGTAIKAWLMGYFTQITLGGVTRSTWPAAGSGSQSMNDVYDNGSVVNVDNTDQVFALSSGKHVKITNAAQTVTYWDFTADTVYEVHEVSEFPDDHTQAGLNLLDDADAAAQRATLGLGSMATQNANNVSVSGGSISGITDLATADGGTGASTPAQARINLGLAIGTDVLAYEAYPVHEITEFPDDFAQAGLDMLAAVSAAAQRILLGLVIGTNVQAHSAKLVDIAALAVTDSNIIVGNGSTWVAETGATARTSLGLGIGADVMAYEAWPIHESEELCGVD